MIPEQREKLLTDRDSSEKGELIKEETGGGNAYQGIQKTLVGEGER